MTSTNPLHNAAPLSERLIIPHSGTEAFFDASRSLWKGFAAARHLAWRFFLRDTRAEHRQSLLGYFWLLAIPLANTLVWVFLNDQHVIRIDTGAVPYPVFVLAGTVLWAAFNGSLMTTLGVIGSARGMLGKVNFPHESLLYAAFLKALRDASIAALLLIPAVTYFRVPAHAEMLLFPVALLACLLLGGVLGLLALPLAGLYTDVSRIVQLFLRFGFFLTPVIFPLPSGGVARALMLLNPVTPLMVTGRTWLVGSGETMMGAFAGVVAASVLFLYLGLLFYKVALPHLIERLSA